MNTASPLDRLSIMPLDSRDVDDVVLMERLCFSCPWSAEQIRAAFGLREFMVLGLKEDSASGIKGQGRLLAYVSFYHLPPEMEILNLAVHPFHRRQGLGAHLLGSTLQWAAKRGIHDVHLEVRVSNTPARNLYAAHGFMQVGTRKNYYPDTREDALVLRRDLAGSASPRRDSAGQQGDTQQ